MSVTFPRLPSLYRIARAALLHGRSRCDERWKRSLPN